MNYIIRELSIEDLEDDKGFFETLSNLSEMGNISFEKKKEIFNENKEHGFTYVAVDREGFIVGNIKLIIEKKFSHGGGLAGHIEDVVVKKEYQGQGIARSLIDKAIKKARELGCYKVILSSSEALVPFYKKFGFDEFEKTLRINP